jgi:hypothetical protein
MKTESDGFVKRIVCLFFHGYGDTVGHLSRNRTGRIDQRGEPPVICGVPQVLRKLGPPLVHIGGAARITGKQSEYEVRLAMVDCKPAVVSALGWLVGNTADS